MFLLSYIPENNPKMFGDYMCKGGHSIGVGTDNYRRVGCKQDDEPSKHWGFRHWVWMFAGLTFALWNVGDVVTEIDRNLN
jgi:hypothetical protein